MMLLARSRLGPPQARITHTRSGDTNHPGAQQPKEQWAGDPLSMGSRPRPRKARAGLCQRSVEMFPVTVNRCKGRAIVDGIMYQRLGSEQYYAQELLDQDIVGHLHRMITDTEHKSPYEYVMHDSAIEARFAEQLEMNSGIKLSAKPSEGRSRVGTLTSEHCASWNSRPSTRSQRHSAMS